MVCCFDIGIPVKKKNIDYHAVEKEINFFGAATSWNIQMTNALLNLAHQIIKSQETRLILKTENEDVKEKDFEKKTGTYSF